MRRVLVAVCSVLCFAGVPASVATAATTTTSVSSAASTAPPVPSLVTTPVLAPVVATTAVSSPGAKKSARTTVNILIGVLLALAALVIGISVWYWRVTKPLPVQLEPLATMSTRSWRKAPPARREASLEKVRPNRPLDPMLAPVGNRATDTAAHRALEAQADEGGPS